MPAILTPDQRVRVFVSSTSKSWPPSGRPPRRRERHERLIASLRDRVDPVPFEEAWSSVAPLDYQGTLDLVLETLDLSGGAPEGRP